MFRSILAPLQSHYAPSASILQSSSDSTTETLEHQETLTGELLRKQVDELKFASDVESRNAVLEQIGNMLQQNAFTRDVFRESDGFLVLMHVLSTLPAFLEHPCATSDSPTTQRILKCMGLAFFVASEALRGHETNVRFFMEFVGNHALSEAVQGLVNNSMTTNMTLGLLVSLTFHDLSLMNMFSSLRAQSHDDFRQIDGRFAEFSSKLGRIHLPGIFETLWNFLRERIINDISLRRISVKVIEHLLQSSHRNFAILSNLRIVDVFLSLFHRCRHDPEVTDEERRKILKILKRLCDMGASTNDVRMILHNIVKEDETLDADMLDIIRSSMRSRWPPHLSLDSGASVTTTLGALKHLPGLTFMIWLWVDQMPSDQQTLFSISIGTNELINLSIGSEGTLTFQTAANRDVAVLSNSKPTIRFFIDGVLSDSLTWAYPKIDDSSISATLKVGGVSSLSNLAWSIASLYLLTVTLDDELPRFIHHLGPRYSGTFQDQTLVRFLTYEASTSLNMHILGQATSTPTMHELSPLKQAIQDGISLSENSILVHLIPSQTSPEDTLPSIRPVSTSKNCDDSYASQGSVVVTHCQPPDLALWKIGGPALVLRLIMFAQTSHELSRVLSVLSDSLRNCWQNCDDMERMHGYDVLANLLQMRSHLINMTAFETLFELLGLNFRSPDHSTIVNSVGYRALALDFELWSRTHPDIQRVHLEHFSFLLRASRFRRFNVKVRLSKLGIVRKLLHVLQSAWYPNESTPHIINALVVVAQASFSADDAIKPIVSFIVGNISKDQSLPQSAHLSIPSQHPQKAELVLEALVSLLRIPTLYAKFGEAIPVARICLLLLGGRPSSSIAALVLSLVGLSITTSPSFGKKFDMARGWAILRIVLPPVWDGRLHEAALDLLLGRTTGRESGILDSQVVSCPQVALVILAALRQGVIEITQCKHSPNEIVGKYVCLRKITTLIRFDWLGNAGPAEDVTRLILEDMISLHETSPSFRQVFRSQTAIQILIDAAKTLSTHSTSQDAGIQPAIPVYERLTHFSSLIAGNKVVSSTHKNEILKAIQLGSQSHLESTSDVSKASDMQEESVYKAIGKLEEWGKTTSAAERKRYQKTVLDLRENRRQISFYTTRALSSAPEHSPRADSGQRRPWRLDETEGPSRIRKKMEPIDDIINFGSKPTAHERKQSLISSELDTVSLVQEDSRESPERQDFEDHLVEEVVEDKHRRVRHELEPGDVIEAVSTVSRISGVDCFPGLLIIGRTHMYMLDGLVENDAGEVIDAQDAPKGLFFVAGTIDFRKPQRAQRWILGQLAGYEDRSFLFQDIALEMFFQDSRTLLTVFLSKTRRQDVTRRLHSLISRSAHEIGAMSGAIPSLPSVLGRASLKAKALMQTREKELLNVQRKWQNREISNFTYLCILNQLSGRTPSDATQYPIIPWVLKDYTSDMLDLSAPESYRELSKPMGALTEERCESAYTRYDSLESVGEKPFHYGTHFSSSMIVCHFLIRMAPFTDMFKTLQGGEWDLPDRLFAAYTSAAQDIRGDVRELIPEFFCCPEFLENSSKLDFGISQSSGQRIDDVHLPPWAKQDPLLFVHMHRRALESHHVSENLPGWIDLIWGYKQRDILSLNVFHPLSYEGSIDLDKITDDLEKEATVGIIHNFGQTPRKLFSCPHPPRNMRGLISLPLGVSRGIPEDALALVRENKLLKVILQNPVASIAVDETGKVVPLPDSTVQAPSHLHEQVNWDRKSGILQLVSRGKVVQTIESIAPTCAAFADANTLVTGSSDFAVRVWHLNHGVTHSSAFSSTTKPTRKDAIPNIALLHLLRTHTAAVTCVAVSRVWSLIVSGSQDGSAVTWDLNRGCYGMSIWHPSGNGYDAIHLATINESNGYIATCSVSQLWLHTINARPITKLDLGSSLPRALSTPSITSIAFHEREYSHLELLATGNHDGSITLWTWNADGTPAGCKARWEFVEVRKLVPEHPVSANDASAITAVKFNGETLLAGNSFGETYLWSIPS
ncbi:hypothetical protein BJ138DRAFT_1124827 [Hygrophoropsis aurantiaca]|uniref:Uncharacterized protein n=1 Tax=Hygrophoropsis aurantiaca TaxID=72124 RepID=A0ACB8AI09_9AGAM|nr:hypothetical protein BJ138DRAFT_1124827 [Hygrophoropsis aurantiaca]